MASCRGKKLSPQLAQKIGSRLTTRIEGTGIKHHLGKVSIKIDDQFPRVLRLETTTHDVSFFKHHRKVEHRDGYEFREMAPLQKTIYRLIDPRDILMGCNRRNLEFLSALDDFSAGDRNLHRLTHPKTVDGHTLKGFNFFDHSEQTGLRALQRAEFNIRGICRADLTRFLPDVSVSRITRFLGRLRQFGLIKKVAHRYRYDLTHLGRSTIATT